MRASAKQQQRAHHVIRQGFTNSSSVRTHESKLHLREVTSRDSGICERAEASGDAIHHAILANSRLDDATARLHASRD